MKKLLRFIPILSIPIFLSACSYSLRGNISDLVTGDSVSNATVTLITGGDENPSETADENGEYKIKKDNEIQTVTFEAEGYEPTSLEIENDKDINVTLIPSPRETARRIVDGMIAKNLESVYVYFHPNFLDAMTLEEFIESNSEFENLTDRIISYRIAEVEEGIEYQSPSVNKTYENVTVVTVLLTLDADGGYEQQWKIYLQKMAGSDEKEFYHWIMSRTTGASI